MSNVFHKNPYVVSCERHGLIPLACVFRRRRSPLATFLTHTQPQRCSHGYGKICSLAVVNELFADQIIRSGREYEDHVNRLQPVSFTCHLVSPTILHTVHPLPLESTTCSFVQDLSFRASLVYADQEVAGVSGNYFDGASGSIGSGAGAKRKRARASGGREVATSVASADAGGVAAIDSRDKALELKGPHFRCILMQLVFVLVSIGNRDFSST